MSIVTRKGDAGTTTLMYGRQVSKTDARVEAYGTVDELNAALGLARAGTGDPWLQERLLQVQRDLVTLMGELATRPEDLARYEKDGYRRVGPPLTQVLEDWVREIEALRLTIQGWVMPGATMVSAALDLARTVCRRAERSVCGVHELGQLGNPDILIYLNRLSDVLWLMARREESRQEG